MAAQLILSIPTVSAGRFRWAWRDGLTNVETQAEGDKQALASSIEQVQQKDNRNIETWLILPGEKLVTKEFAYNEQEKKHLRRLLPFQLEDSIVEDIDDLHIAMATPDQGKVSFAYINQDWLQQQFSDLTALGLEIVRCSVEFLSWKKTSDEKQWHLAFYNNFVHLQYGKDLGFSLSTTHASLALNLLASREQPQQIFLRAETQADVEKLQACLPAACSGLPQTTKLIAWHDELADEPLDLCQGKFSRRLPIERWWSLWRSLAIFAGVCVLISLFSVMMQIRQLNKENLAIRAATESAARTVIPQGRLTNPEKQLSTLLSQLKPSQVSTGLVELLSQVLPVISNKSNVKIKALNYSQESGELAINLQAKDFAVFESITSELKAQQLQAEILNVNAQGDAQTARLRINR